MRHIIKKLVVILMAFSLLSLFGCGRRQKYSLSCDPGIETERTSYREGEKVTLRVHTVMDEITEVYIDGEKLVPGLDSNDDWQVYTFTMPAHDVRAECVSINISVEPQPDEVREILLIECYSQVTGTPVERPHELAKLLREPDGSLLLRWETGTSKDLDTKEYTVPERCLEEAMEYILGEEMDKWHELYPSDPLDGYYGSCNFLLDGEWITIDTESSMPEHGVGIINHVRMILMGYIPG